MVSKKNRSWRPCGHYRRLNLVTTPDKYPLPNMQDLSNGLHGCSVFYKNRSCQGLSPTPVGDNVMSPTENIPKTAIITPFGLFEYFSHLMGCPTLHKLFKE
jgi:hypothetical protein